MWWHAVTQSTEEVAESSVSGYILTRKRKWHLGLAWASETLKPAPSDTLPPGRLHVFQHGFTFNNAIPYEPIGGYFYSNQYINIYSNACIVRTGDLAYIYADIILLVCMFSGLTIWPGFPLSMLICLLVSSSLFLGSHASATLWVLLFTLLRESQCELSDPLTLMISFLPYFLQRYYKLMAQSFFVDSSVGTGCQYQSAFWLVSIIAKWSFLDVRWGLQLSGGLISGQVFRM